MDLQTFSSNLKIAAQKLCREYKLYGVLVVLIIIHQSYFSLPCYVSYFGVSCWSNDTFEQKYKIFLSLIGFIQIIYSINADLRITQDMSLRGYFKSKTPPNPFREIKLWTVNANATSTVSKPRVDVVGTTHKEPETVDDIYKILKQQSEEYKKMIGASEQQTGEKIESLERELLLKTNEALTYTHELQEKFKTVVGSSIDGRLVGSILVLYAALIN